MYRTLFAAGRIPARNATRTPETPAMSKTYHVTVSFYVEAPSREDAMGFVTEYLDDASRCVIDPRHIVDVDVAGAEEVPDYPAE